MALLSRNPNPVARSKPFVRGGKASHRRPKHTRSHSDQGRAGSCPQPGSESFIAELLDEVGIAHEYEPTLFALTLTGRGKQGFKPDFYLPEYNIYLEVTEGNDIKEAFKRTKIHNVQRVHSVRVLLVGRDMIRDLRSGQLDIFDLVDPLDSESDLILDASIVA